MSRPIKTINLDENEQLTLEAGLGNHSKREFRQRCQMLLLSHKGQWARQISFLLDTSYQSVINCFAHWQQGGLVGLMRRRGQGRKAKLSLVDQQQLKAIVSQHRPSARLAAAQLQQELSIGLHPETLRRFLKSITILSVVSAKALKADKTTQKGWKRKAS